MRKFATFFFTFFLMIWSVNAWSFACKTNTGGNIPIGGGTANVYVNLAPEVNIGQVLVVDLSKQVFCHNDDPSYHTDMLRMWPGTMYNGALQGFSGSIKFNGSYFSLPLAKIPEPVYYTSKTDTPIPVQLYLTPISVAGSIAIASGTPIASLIMLQSNNKNDSALYIWNIYSNNNVIVPTGGCDVTARNVAVNLPDYPTTAEVPVPIMIHCTKNQNIGYYLSGSTTDSSSSIFTNTASASQSQGVGIQILEHGRVMPANHTVSLGGVGDSPVDLGLTATYARTTGPITAGNVQSIIGVTFVYQ